MHGLERAGLLKKLICGAVCAAFALQLGSCGTILYPERHGQRSGELDPTVVLLDAIGLLFGIIPGLVAFAVDFHTGAIYLPGGKKRPKHHRRGQAEEIEGGWVILRTDPRTLDAGTLSAILSRETGHTIRLDDPRMVLRTATGRVDIAAKLEQLSLAMARPAASPF